MQHFDISSGVYPSYDVRLEIPQQVKPQSQDAATPGPTDSGPHAEAKVVDTHFLQHEHKSEMFQASKQPRAAFRLDPRIGNLRTIKTSSKLHW